VAIRRHDLAEPSVSRTGRSRLLAAAIERPIGPGLHPIGLVGDVLNLLDLASENFERDDETSKTAIFQATVLLRSELQRHGGVSGTRDATVGLSPRRVELLRTYIEGHIEEPIHVKHLSGAVRLSNSYFCRAFRQTFGQTPHAYVTSRRVLRAKTLLLDGAQPLSAIALLCGFADQAHLSKLFREHAGESPAAWRQRRASGDTEVSQLEEEASARRGASPLCTIEPPVL
jgi:AraC-like DNA-binding protein